MHRYLIVCWSGVALLALSGCGGRTSIDISNLPSPVNTPLVSTSAEHSQMVAADALGRIGQPAVPELSQALTDSNAAVRLQACRALAYMGAQAKDAVPGLTQTLSDSNEIVREQAATALGMIGPPAEPAVPALMQMLRRSQKQ